MRTDPRDTAMHGRAARYVGRMIAANRYTLEAEPGTGDEPLILQARRVGATSALTPHATITVHQPGNDLGLALVALAERLEALVVTGRLKAPG